MSTGSTANYLHFSLLDNRILDSVMEVKSRFYTGTEDLPSFILNYTLRRILKIDEKISALKVQVDAIQERLDKSEEQAFEIRRGMIRVKTSVAGAMDEVALFSAEHLDKLKAVHFGWADSEYRFVFVTIAEEFDWDFCDSVTCLEIALVKNYQEIPLSCKVAPFVEGCDVDAILEHSLSELNLIAIREDIEAERTSDAVG